LIKSSLKDLLKLNPYAPQFADAQDKDAYVNKLLTIKNSQGTSTQELDYLYDTNGVGYFSDSDVTYLDFAPLFENKRARILKYREMSLYPEIMDALESIINDSIVDNNDDGEILTLDIKTELPSGIKKRINSAFSYFINDVLNFPEKGEEYFKRWLIEGELYGELITNDAGDNIIGIKILPSFTMAPVYKNGLLAGYVQIANSPIRTYKQANLKNQTPFEPNQIAYSNYGSIGENELDIRGFLESAVKVYNMLKSLEDSIVIYRLVRAPERRIWNIYTGRMPKGKSEEYIKGVMKRYRTKNLYDPATGNIDSAQNIQTMSHDIWFGTDDSGHGTTVTTIGGAMNLGEITDLDWFKEKLYKALRLPTSRWVTDQAQGPYSSGKMGEITKEEIKFARFIEKLQRRFKYFILNPFFTLLRMRGIPEEYLDRKFYDIKFCKSNLFKEFKEIEIREARLGVLSSVAGYIASRDNINQSEGLFSKEFVLKRYFKMTDDEFNLNKTLIDKELAEAAEIAANYPPINPYETNPVPDVTANQPTDTSTNTDQTINK